MTGDRFERDLAEALAARDPGAVPASLTARVVAIPDRAPVGTLRRFRSTFPSLAAAAAVALLAIGLAWGLRAAPTGPGASGGPAASVPPPRSATIQAGDGFARVDPPLGHTLLIGALFTAAIVGAVRTTSIRRFAALGGALVVVGAAFGLASLDVLESETSSGTIGSTPAADGSGIDVHAVGPNASIPVEIWLANGSRLPITVRGLAAAPVVTATVGVAPPRIVAMGLPRSGAIDLVAVPFRPVELAPGEDVGVLLFIDSGDCAATFDTETRIALKSVDVAVDVLGMMRVEQVTFAEIWIPQAAACPP